MPKSRNQSSLLVSDAASLLGRIKSPKKAIASVRNGALGGRPCYGVCSPRELRRRIRRYVEDHVSYEGAQVYYKGSIPSLPPFRIYQSLVCDALCYRQEIIDRLKASGSLGEDAASRIVFSHPLVSSVEDWRRLVLKTPGFL